MLATRRMLLAASAAALAPPARSHAQGGAAELRFGALFPLSGPQALLGDECFRGIEMATEERNAAGGVLGRQVRLLRADVTDAAQAQAEARRLASLTGPERPVALFGTLDTQLSLAASQAAELQGMPYLELVAPGNAVTERGFQLLFRTCPRAAALARTALEAVAPLADLLGTPEVSLRLAILHADAPGPQALAEALEARIRDSGLTLAARAGYGAQPSEIGAAVRRMRSSEAQVVLHAARGADTVPFFRALQEEGGWQPRAVIGLGGDYMLRETARSVGPAFEATLVADLPQPEVAERFAPAMPAFADAYRRRYGADMRSGHSIACYAGALLCYEALQRAGGAEPARLRAALLATDVPERGLANGWGARFDERGQNLRARPVLQQWREGRLLAVGPAEAAVASLAVRSS